MTAHPCFPSVALQPRNLQAVYNTYQQQYGAMQHHKLHEWVINRCISTISTVNIMILKRLPDICCLYSNGNKTLQKGHTCSIRVIYCSQKFQILNKLYSNFMDGRPTLCFVFVYRKYRYTAYRHFTSWLFGKHVRVVLTVCIVTAIQTKFLSDKYQGFTLPVIS
jgi:hypothetical protein